MRHDLAVAWMEVREDVVGGDGSNFGEVELDFGACKFAVSQAVSV
jgi:hypothetical protein